MGDGPPAPPEERELPPEWEAVIHYIADPQTRAWEFSAVGPNAGGISLGAAQNHPPEDGVLHIMAASMLLDLVPHTDQSDEEFIRSVVGEYNDRKSSATTDWVARDDE